MPTFTKLKSGSWRVQVRRKREYVANTFIRRRDAEEWAIEVERSIDRGVPIRRSRYHEPPRIFADLIALHLDDLAQVGKPVRRSKSMVLKALKASLGRVNLKDITRDRLIEFGRKRAAQGAGPATIAIDFSFIRTILTHAAAVRGIEISVESVQLARAALRHLDLVGKSNERDRRPTQDELDRLIEYAECNPQQFIPLGRIIRFAVATAMRQAEILPDRMARCRYEEANGHHPRSQRPATKRRKSSGSRSPQLHGLRRMADYSRATYRHARHRARVSSPPEIRWSCIPSVVQRYRSRRFVFSRFAP
jgi:hypothetical protein